MPSPAATDASAPLISVIVPVFNAADTVERCLESVLNQDYRGIELIVVDGASSDGTVPIARVFLGSGRPVHLVSERDRGVYDAMNKGVAMARGKWLYFLGSDDYLSSRDVLGRVASELTDDVAFVFGKIRRLSAGRVEGSAADVKNIVDKNICQQGIFYSASLFSRLGGFDERYRICADWCFNIRCMGLPCRTRFVDIVVCDYNGRGMSSRITDELFYLDRPALVAQAFRIGYLSLKFRRWRYLMHEAAMTRREQGRTVHAFGYWLVFVWLSVWTKLLPSDVG